VARLAAGAPETDLADGDVPPFLGGLVGYLGYDLGHALERLPAIATDDQNLPALRLALHDWVVAWDRRTGAAWIGGRAADGDAAARLAPGGVIERLRNPGRGPRARFIGPTSHPSLDRAAYMAGVGPSGLAPRATSQANPTRRLGARSCDPGPLTAASGPAPVAHAAYLDLGGAGRSSCVTGAAPAADAAGRVTTDPIKPRGGTAGERTATSRASCSRARRTAPRT
jgi:anthranilate/para-aminobenzoate synthase component I